VYAIFRQGNRDGDFDDFPDVYCNRVFLFLFDSVLSARVAQDTKILLQAVVGGSAASGV
jgi:hypothetical protein